MGSGNNTPSTPSAKSSTYSINGQTVASQTPDANGNYSSSVTLTPYQNSIENYANDNMSSALSGVNTLDANTQKSITDSAQAAYDNGLADLNHSYDTTNMNTMNDVSRRLGTLDASSLNDANNTNNYNYNQGLSTLSNDYINNIQNYKQQALSENNNYANTLLNASNNVYNQANGYNTAASGLTSAGNNTAQQQYQDALANQQLKNQYNQQQYQNAQSMFGSSGNTSQMAYMMV